MEERLLRAYGTRLLSFPRLTLLTDLSVLVRPKEG